MRVLVTNDDGPPDEKYSPYILNFVTHLKKLTDWDISVAVPSQQRSWIGKAHIIGQEIEGRVTTYEETGDIEWLLLTGTPASCASIGLCYLGKFDLVISGPNFGRNTSAAYIMSSGTVGATLEASLGGVPGIALSFSYTVPKHSEEDISKGSEVAVAVVKYLYNHWNSAAQIYSVNIPLFPELSLKTPIKYTEIFHNNFYKLFDKVSDDEHKYKWAPDYDAIDKSVLENGEGSDAWVVMHNEITVSPIRGIFQGVKIEEEIVLT